MVFVGACAVGTFADYPVLAGGLADSDTGVAAGAVVGTLGETIDTTAAAVLVQVGAMATPAALGAVHSPMLPSGAATSAHP